MAELGSVTDQNFADEVLAPDTLALVDFWSDDCPPCRVIAPILADLAGDYEGRVKIVKLNVYDNPATPSKFGVRAMPTVLAFAGGERGFAYAAGAIVVDVARLEQIVAVRAAHVIQRRHLNLNGCLSGYGRSRAGRNDERKESVLVRAVGLGKDHGPQAPHHGIMTRFSTRLSSTQETPTFVVSLDFLFTHKSTRKKSPTERNA